MSKAAHKVGTVHNVLDQIGDNDEELYPIWIPVEADIIWAHRTDFYYEH